jgi:hypothetical protein
MRREIQRMLLETSAFVPVSHLFWGVWGLLQVEVSPVGFGFAVSCNVYVCRIDNYCRNMDAIDWRYISKQKQEWRHWVTPQSNERLGS